MAIELSQVVDIDAGATAGETRLRRAYLHLAEAQRLSQTGSFTWDFDRNELLWSEGLCRIFEFDPKTTVTIERVQQYVHAEDIPAWLATVEGAAAGVDIDLAYRIETASGTKKHLRAVGHVVEHSAGRPVFVGAVQDVTQAKLAEEALSARERELRLIVDSIPGMVAVFTATGELESVNSRTLEYFGATSEEIKDWQGGGFTHPDDNPRTVEVVLRAFASGEPFVVETRARRFDGEYRWFQSRGLPLKDAHGRVVRWYDLLTDIDDLKRSEEARRRGEAELKEAHLHLTEAQRLSRTGSFTWDTTTDDHVWSDECYRISEFDRSTKVTAELILGAIHPDDTPRVSAAMARAADGEDFDLVYRLVTASGATKHLHCVGHRLAQIADRSIIVGAIQDVTETTLAEDALTRARAELAHVARAATLSALTASIAHEVNQPLTSLVTNASTCLRMLGAEPPNLDLARTTAQRTIRDANRASEVIQRLRAMFARKQPATQAVNLNEAAREVLALSSGELQAARVVLHADLAEGLPSVCGDRIQLQQVILNLVLNAADAMRSVVGRPRALLLTTTFEAPDCVRLSVRDSGVGIEPQNVERLFDPFFTTKSEGMGIGLSISRSIIQLHDGRLWATPNDDGPGATFTFSMPCQAGGAAAFGLKDA